MYSYILKQASERKGGAFAQHPHGWRRHVGTQSEAPEENATRLLPRSKSLSGLQACVT